MVTDAMAQSQGLSSAPAPTDDNEIDPDRILSGEIDGCISFTGGFIQSKNFVSGSIGWRLSANGTLEAVNGIFSGTIIATDFTFKDSAGNVVMQGGSSGGSNGYVLEIVTSGTVNNGIRVSMNQSVSQGIFVASSVSGNGFYYINSSNVAGRGLFIQLLSSGANNTHPGIEVQHATSTGNVFGILVNGSNAAGGALLQTTGTGRSLYLLNSGTSNSLAIDDSNTSGSSSCILINFARGAPVIDIITSIASGNPTGIKMALSSGAGTACFAFSFNGNEIVHSAVVGVQNKKIKITISGATYFIPAYDG